MPSLLRLFPLTVVLLLSWQASVQAQKMRLPSEGELNRQGLTMSWWGQAGVNPQRDTVEFFTADEQNVFIQSTTGLITCFHGELGKRQWSQLVGAPEQQSYPLTTSDEDVVVIIGLHLHALKKDSGRKIWELVVNEYPSTAPTIDEEHIFVGTIDGSVLAYHLPKIQSLYKRGMLPQWATRAFLWNFKTPDLIVSPPISAGKEVVFASRRGIVYSLKSENKQLHYQLETGNEIKTPVGYSKDQIFVADRFARMLCMNLSNGKVQWVFTGGSPIQQQPRVVGDAVYVIPRYEGLISIARKSGVQNWQQSQATSFVAASETHVYARDENKNLLVLDRTSGQITGTINVRNFEMHAANDRTDRIFLASRDGVVVAIREVGSEYPLYHLYPERRPILPEFAPEEGTEPAASDNGQNSGEKPAEETQTN